ncbi:uncharacterized protein LOC106138570 [Amyelois transitella]|uniref:uncharacterized protein LOC106138570 n=1 Tax=Amyelois transitella TaxID=680683 RepID=UPI00298FB749|nr:uncharacterized protein LOC106138570 [Amyelois transitella]
MASGGSGAVFFLGTRAHYQVLQQPERSYDAENGNASTETIYQNPSVRETWTDNAQSDNASYVSDRTSFSYCDDVSDDNRLEIGSGVKRRNKRRPSETTLCERDNEMKPALLNSLDRGTPVRMSLRRLSPLSLLSSLGRRKRRHSGHTLQHIESALTVCSGTPVRMSLRRLSPLSLLSSLGRRKRRHSGHTLQHIESALTVCSYRESCRCLDCQSRYFECDDSEGYTSDDSDFTPRYASNVSRPRDLEYGYMQDGDDEVFTDTAPDDSTSTDMLIDKKMSVSSASSEDPETMQLEVAAGTPVLLNYLLTHPITCSIQ